MPGDEHRGRMVRGCDADLSPNVLLVYATRDGQSRRVAARIANQLAKGGIAAPPLDLAVAFPEAVDLAASRVIAVVAAVRYGHHLPEAERFLKAHRHLLALVPLAVVSVNLTARKPGRDTAGGNRYLQKWLARHRLKPALATAVAGRLDYPRYGWLDKQIIRLIMRVTGGPTDPRSCVEFTRWSAVDEIALRIADLHRRAAEQAVQPT